MISRIGSGRDTRSRRPKKLQRQVSETLEYRRLLASASLDFSFGNNGLVSGSASSNFTHIAAQADGKVVVIDPGQVYPNENFVVDRFTAAGQPDPTFGTNGIVSTPIGGVAANLAIQPDGKIVVVGTSYNSLGFLAITVVRYDTNGTLDTTFGGTGIVRVNTGSTDGYCVAINSIGQIAVGGSNEPAQPANSDPFTLPRVTLTVAEFNSDGSVNTAFGTNGISQVPSIGDFGADALAFDSLNNILITAVPNASRSSSLVRLTPLGALDTSFGVNGVTQISATAAATTIAVEPNGLIDTAVASATSTDTVYRFISSGIADSTFGSNGQVTLSLSDAGAVYSTSQPQIAVESGDKIVLADNGYFNHIYSINLFQLTPSGALDPSFGTGGRFALPYSSSAGSLCAVAVMTNGDIVQSSGQYISQIILNPATITGTVYSDSNDNGTLDTNESGLAGRTVYLDSNNNGVLDQGEISTVTTTGGYYSFSNLPVGTYLIKEVSPTGYYQSQPVTAGYTDALSAGQNAVCNFGSVDESRVLFLSGGVLNIPSFSTASIAPNEVGNVLVQVNGPNQSFAADLISTINVNYPNYNSMLAITSLIGDGAFLGGVTPAINVNCTVASVDVTFNTSQVGDSVTIISGPHGPEVEDASTNVVLSDTVGEEQFLTIQGGPGNDVLDARGYTGGPADSGIVLWGGDGNDTLYGSDSTTDGTGVLLGQGGNNVIYAADGHAESVIGGSGNNEASYDSYDSVIDIQTPLNSSIAGTVYNDLNGNSVHDAGEPDLAGTTVYIDANNNGVLDPGEVTQVTNASGAYTFNTLAAGNYTVRAVTPVGDQQTAPVNNAGQTVTLGINQAITSADFGEQLLPIPTGGSISGTVTNNIAGETIYLDTNNNSILDAGELSTTTTTTGSYSFSNVPAGTYVIRQVLAGGYTQTSPAAGTGIGITVANGSSLTNENFTDQTPVIINYGSISGIVSGGVGGEMVYLDANNNSALDTGELSTATSSTGAYSFSNVPVGSYQIRQVLTAGYSQMIPANGAGIGVTVTSNATLTNENFIDVVATATPLTGTVIGTAGFYGNSGNTIAKAFDGSFSTYFDGPTANGNYVGLDLGSSAVISQIAYAPRSTYASRMVGGIFQGSNSADFSNAVNLFTIATAPAYGVLTTVNVGSTTAYRYVRYVSPAGGYGNVAELDFYGSIPVTATKLTGTIIGTAGSYNNQGNTIAKAFDGSFSTYFDGPTANGNYVGLDLGSATVISQIAYAPRGTYASRMVGGIFQGSNSADFSSAVNLFTITTAPAYGTLTTVNVGSTTAYRYVRYVSPTGSYGNVAELDFYGSTPLTATKLTGTTIGTPGSYQNDGSTIAMATDGNLSTFFDGPTANGNWVGLDLGTAQMISQISFAPRSGWASRMVGGLIQISTTADFSSGVTTIYTISSTPTTGSLTTITLSSPVTARYIRFLSPNGGYGNISEFQVFG